MITEDYVSFEVAKLLKEKGFNIQCWMYYSPDTFGPKMFHTQRKGNSQLIPEWEECVCPTIQLAMKWLRETQNLFVFPFPQMNANKFWVEIYQLSDNKEWENLYCESIDLKDYPLYEQACEAGIKYCLENLI